jgi:hypothetical protein
MRFVQENFCRVYHPFESIVGRRLNNFAWFVRWLLVGYGCVPLLWNVTLKKGGSGPFFQAVADISEGQLHHQNHR